MTEINPLDSAAIALRASFEMLRLPKLHDDQYEAFAASVFRALIHGSTTKMQQTVLELGMPELLEIDPRTQLLRLDLLLEHLVAAILSEGEIDPD